MDEVDLALTHLDGTNLHHADLRNARLCYAVLHHADLRRACLHGADLYSAYLGQALLDRASLDATTNLDEAFLTDASLGEINFGGANLCNVDWAEVPVLGDELAARTARSHDGRRKSRQQRIADYAAAALAYQRLVRALRENGLREEAERYDFRAQLMQRGLHFQRRQFGRWLGSWTLAALAGYGYRLWRIFIAYGLVLAVFALIFWALGVHSYGAEPWYQALWDSFLVSLSAIHGRAVFEQLGAWTPAAWVAAIESVIGIVIEGVFVAMLIQRFFGK